MTWTLADVVDSDEGQVSGWERTYWGISTSKGVFSSATSITTTDASKMNVKVVKGDEKTATSYSHQTYTPKSAIVFRDRALVADWSGIYELTPQGKTLLPGSSGISPVKDFTVKDNVLYVLTSSGVYVSEDAVSWKRVTSATVPTVVAQSRTLAVYDGYLYLGGSQGKIYRSGVRLSDPQPVVTPKAKDSNVTMENPGVGGRVFRPTLEGTEKDGTAFSAGHTFRITSVSANGLIFHQNKVIRAGAVINTYHSNELQLDPLDGVQKVQVKYQGLTEEGEWTTEATITVNFESA